MKDNDSNDANIAEKGINRRRFLSIGIISLLSGLFPGNSIAAVKNFILPERMLSFYNPYTDEALETVYWKDGSYVASALDEINHILRDIRTGMVKTIDRSLLDLLHAINRTIGNSKPFQVVSGYRTPKSNAILRKKKQGVAKNSLHIYGKAIDIRIPDLSLKSLRQVAMDLEAGGVGYYPRSNFLHVDVGEIRYWRG